MTSLANSQSAQSGGLGPSAFAAAGALALVLLSFLGWVLHEPALRGFGAAPPIWPLTAIGFAFLAIAQLVQLRGNHVPGLALFTIPFMIGTAGSLQWLPGLGGLHTVLFGEELARIRAVYPGRAPFMVMVDWGLLIAAMLLVRRRSWRSCLIACILANIPLALSIMTIALVIAKIPISGGPAYYLWTSLPASLATVLLSLSVFLWCRACGGVTDGEDTAGWTFVRVFPVIMLLPGLIWLFEIIAITEGTSGGLFMSKALGLNMALIAMVLVWAMYRMSRQQATLREFTHALDSTSVSLIHPDGTVAHWSRGCEELFGWTAAKVVGSRQYEFLETQFDDGETNLHSLSLGEELKREVTHKTRDGRKLRILEHVRRIDTGKRKPMLVVAITDVTERNRREASLEAYKTLIEEVLDTMPEGVVAFDTDGIVRRFSAGAVKMLGYEPNEILGKHFSLLTAEHRRETVTNNLKRFVETGIPRFVGRVVRNPILAKDGREVEVEQRAIQTMAGKKKLIVMFVRDLTETIAYETRLGTLGAQLGHTARLSAMGEMAAGMAHELNQPLAAIVNYMGAARFLIDEGGDSIRIRELVESAQEQTLRAGQIIQRMRDFGSNSQAEMGAVPIEQMIRDAAALVFIGLRPHDIELTYDLDPEAGTMFGDRIQIQQVLVNLLRNAVQALSVVAVEDRRIKLSTALRGTDMIEISVSDSGLGIPESARAELFAPFTASGGKGGMGIGLSICRRIVEAHGGEIWAEDGEEGKGVTFRFTVPS